jgi:hypothetical protein
MAGTGLLFALGEKGDHFHHYGLRHRLLASHPSVQVRGRHREIRAQLRLAAELSCGNAQRAQMEGFATAHPARGHATR